MLGDQRHKAVIGSKLIEDIVGDKKHLLLKILDVRMAQQIRIGCLEYLACFVRNQMISSIVVIFEIKIESALCNACFVNYVSDRGFAESFGREEFIAVLRSEFSFNFLLFSTFPIIFSSLQHTRNFA